MLQTGCRHFNGYKPCGKNETCSEACPFVDLASPRILIVHLEALGAVLRATVILDPIKKKWPKSHVTWVTAPRARELLENNPHIDRIVSFDAKGIMQLKALQFEHTFVVDKSLEAAGLALMPRKTGEIKGFIIDNNGAVAPANVEAHELYEIGLNNHKKFFVNKKPETRLITEALALDYKKSEYVFHFTDAEKEKIKTLRTQLGITKPVIGLNLGCSGVIPYKKLSFSGWQKVIDEILMTQNNCHILLLGGPEDKQVMHDLKIKYSQQVIATPTDLGLRSGMMYVELCDSVITGDSLGMHMAIALKKHVVAWFGPTCAHEIDLYGRGQKVLAQVPCGPCWKRSCDKETMCYDLVPFETLVSAAQVGLKSNHEVHISQNSSLSSP
jgi:heptosyltransferase-2